MASTAGRARSDRRARRPGDEGARPRRRGHPPGQGARPRRHDRAGRAGQGLLTRSAPHHVADAPRRPERHRRPDGGARHRRPRGHVARPPVDGPVPEHQPAGRHHRHHLHRRQRPGHREDGHLPHREGRQRGPGRAPRRVAEPARHLGRAGLVQLRRRPEQRPERDHPAHPADQQQPPVRHQAAVHRALRPLEHPGLPAHGLRRRLRREASSTTSPTTRSSPRSSGSTASPPPTWTAARSARSRST